MREVEEWTMRGHNKVGLRMGRFLLSFIIILHKYGLVMGTERFFFQ
jgi:hypothetical protein